MENEISSPKGYKRYHNEKAVNFILFKLIVSPIC